MSSTQLFFIFFFFISASIMAAGDPLAGKQKSLVCSACHGEKGISPNPEWPHLAAQNAVYFIKQIHDFKNGLRPAAVMGPMVANLSEQDMADLAAYYAGLPDTQMPLPATPINKRGEALYRQGDSQQHITACITCHGPDGKGNAEAGFPGLRHQSPLYTVIQLKTFKSGERHNDLNGIMHDISGHLNDEDMKALADYVAAIDVKPLCNPHA